MNREQQKSNMDQIFAPERTRSLLDDSIARAERALLACQRDDGHFVFELEADATIPAEYVLLVHYLGETPEILSSSGRSGIISAASRRIMAAGRFITRAVNISATVKAYFALKMIGDFTDAPHMQRARDAILAEGGAVRANVFTRILLALYGEVSWSVYRLYQSKSFCCPAGSHFTCRKCPIGRAPCWCRSSC